MNPRFPLPDDGTIHGDCPRLRGDRLPQLSYLLFGFGRRGVHAQRGSVVKIFGTVTRAFLLAILDGLCKRVGYSKS